MVEPLDAPDSIPERLGDFRLVDRLGAGGMGVVYRAHDEVLSRDVALKLIRPENLHFEDARERFRREVEAAAKLRHPGIVPIYSVGEEAGLPFFTMELVEGASLAGVIEHLRARPPSELTGADLRDAILAGTHGVDPRGTGSQDALAFSGTWVQACCRLVVQVADALQHAHEHGVLHRDVKPSNIVVTPSGRAMLLDFGLASTNASSRITRTGTQAGSLPYMPPERIHGGLGDADARGDVYSLGVSLYELLALALPFEGETIQRMLQSITAGDSAPLRQRNASVPADAAIVCATAMERDPARRYATADTFARDLRNLLELRPIEAQPPSAALRARRWVQRHPTSSVALGLGFLLLVVAPSVAWWRIRAERDVALRELTVRREMLEFFIGLFNGADPESADAGLRTVQELVEEGARRIRTGLLDQPEVRAPVLMELAQVQGALGRPRDALELGREGLDMMIALTGERSIETARAQVIVGSLLGLLGEYEEAERLLFAARELGLEYRDPTVVNLYDLDLELAANAQRQERLDVARERLAALEADPKSPVHTNRLGTLSWLSIRGEVANSEGDYAETERCYARAVEVATALYGREHPTVARYLQSLGVAKYSLGRNDEALPLLLEVRDLRAKTTRGEAMDDARLEFNLAAVYSKLERPTDSAAAFGRALELCRKLAGDSPQTAKAAAGMGSALFKAGKYDEAERVLREALDLSRRYVPRQGIPGLEAPLWLARCMAKVGRPEEAAPLFEEVLQCLGDDASGRPELGAKIEGELADVLDALNKGDDAAAHRERQKAWNEKLRPAAQ